MGRTINIRRGYDIKLTGAPERTLLEHHPADVFAIKPSDFNKVKPKIIVGPGDSILAGQSLFTDKLRPDLCFPSPVSGEIAEIILGEKRRIQEIRILRDKDQNRYVDFTPTEPSNLDRATIVGRLLESGCWNYILQRPFDTIADPADQPKAIFVSCFDSAPLAPEISYIVQAEKDNFHAGIRALQVVSGNQLHLGLREADRQRSDNPFTAGVPDTHIHYFSGPHPAGNIGIQIHHIDPIRKGEVAWYVHPQDVIIIGRLFIEGRYRADRVIALAGSSVTTPGYLRVQTGERLKEILHGRISEGDHRIIQGHVLHGRKSPQDDFLSFYTRQITVIPEGHEPEFLGWMLPGFKKLSLSRTYFSWLAPNRTYTPTTNMHGEERAFVVTGQYEKVLPMNIYPVFLLKAILAKDIDKMEALGIYEVSEEDFALCEFVCTSKIEVQKIISKGLDLIREEG